MYKDSVGLSRAAVARVGVTQRRSLVAIQRGSTAGAAEVDLARLLLEFGKISVLLTTEVLHVCVLFTIRVK